LHRKRKTGNTVWSSRRRRLLKWHRRPDTGRHHVGIIVLARSHQFLWPRLHLKNIRRIVEMGIDAFAAASQKEDGWTFYLEP